MEIEIDEKFDDASEEVSFQKGKSESIENQQFIKTKFSRTKKFLKENQKKVYQRNIIKK